MSTQGGGEVQDVGGIRLFNSRAFLVHHAHSKSRSRPTAGCGFCPGGVAEDAGVLTIEVPGSGVREGGGDDKEDAAAPAPGPLPWQAIFDGRVSEQGEVR